MAPWSSFRLLLTLALGLTLTASSPAQIVRPAQPPPPDKYKVKLRYEIRSARDQHVALYDAMVEYLKSLDFTFEPPLAERPNTDREDPTKERMEGQLAAAKALRLLGNPSIATILLVPDDFKLPDEADKPVHVRLQLASGFLTDRQRELAEQVLVLLTRLGFREAVGYDNRGYDERPFSRIVGTIPRGRLDDLLKDLRTQPTGWLADILPRDELPPPLAGVNPVRVIEILRDTEPPREVAEPAPREAPFLNKISPELWEIVGGKDAEEKTLRIQIILAGTGADTELDSRRLLVGAAPSFFIEGQSGQYVTGLATPSQVKVLAALPEVVAVRLPRPARVDIDPAVKLAGDNARVLAQSGVAELHKRGARGKGVRLAIIDTDFRAWRKLIADGQLSPRTRLVDLTTEQDPEIYPAPPEGDSEQPGHGTLCAQAAALAAPEASLTLIRLDGNAPYQLQEVLRYLQGGYFSPLSEKRRDELTELRALLERKRAELLKERREILENFTDETDLMDDFGFLGSMYGWVFSDRAWHRERLQYQEKLENALRRRDERLRTFLKEVAGLRGISVVSNPLLWQSSYPPGAARPLSRYFETLQFKGPLWFQAVGNVRGQSWLGPYRSLADGAALEFAEPKAVLPPGRWTSELNFLSWQPYQGEAQPDLPDKTHVRVTLQWREPHDPEYYLLPGGEDPYLRPLAVMRLVLLRQRDPEGKIVPADAFDVIARTSGEPTRLEHLPGSTLYELALDVTLDRPGRYAVRIERQRDTKWILVKHPTRSDQFVFQQLRDLNPTGTRPVGAPTLTGLEKNWELRPHLGVETVDEARRLGRLLLADFRTDAGAIGVPADARGVVSVGAVDLKDRPQPYSAVGAPMLAELRRLPVLWTYDSVELAGGGALGTSVAAAYAAGTTAALLSIGLSREQAVAWLCGQQGQVLRVPASTAKR
jgi:hypothetical protein